MSFSEFGSRIAPTFWTVIAFETTPSPQIARAKIPVPNMAQGLRRSLTRDKFDHRQIAKLRMELKACRKEIGQLQKRVTRLAADVVNLHEKIRA